MNGEGECGSLRVAIDGGRRERAVLLLELLLGDAHEFAGRVGRGEAGDGFELFVVDLKDVSGLRLWSEAWSWVYLWLGLEALPGEREVLHLLLRERHGWILDGRCGGLGNGG